jgi:hypothetical protein
MSESSEAIATLPFVRPSPDGVGRQFWHVEPTGDYQADCALGRGFAVLAVGTAVASRSPSLIGWVMGEMGRNPEWGSVEIGFMRGVADLACMAMSMARGNPACVCSALGSSRRQ